MTHSDSNCGRIQSREIPRMIAGSAVGHPRLQHDPTSDRRLRSRRRLRRSFDESDHRSLRDPHRTATRFLGAQSDRQRFDPLRPAAIPPASDGRAAGVSARGDRAFFFRRAEPPRNRRGHEDAVRHGQDAARGWPAQTNELRPSAPAKNLGSKLAPFPARCAFVACAVPSAPARKSAERADATTAQLRRLYPLRSFR